MRRLKRPLQRMKIMFIDFVQNVLASSYLCPMKIRIFVLNMCGNRICYDCDFSPKSFLGWGKGKLIVGEKTFINYNAFFDLGNDIIIGNRVNIAMNVHFVNSSHIIGDSSRRAGECITKTIEIGDGAWIGADSVIMSGVKIGKGTIIGAGSLVLNDCGDNSIYVGRPAKLLRKLED